MFNCYVSRNETFLVFNIVLLRNSTLTFEVYKYYTMFKITEESLKSYKCARNSIYLTLSIKFFDKLWNNFGTVL